MKRRVFLAFAMALSLGAFAPAQNPAADAAANVPKAGYVTCDGAFVLNGMTGHALYVRPNQPHVLHHRELAYYAYSHHVWWYRDKGTAYFIGFSAYPDWCGRYPVHFGHWDTNGNWHGCSLGSAERTQVAD
jgi:hypothetical protein